MRPSIEDPEFLCFNKLTVKDATQICGGILLALSLLILFFINSVINVVMLGVIMCVASALLIAGVRKKKTWMFSPILWSLSASIWINPISFVICIYYYYTYRNSWMYQFQEPEKREKFHTTVLIIAITNIIGGALSLWFFLIIQKCYNLISFETTVIPYGNNRQPNFSLEDYIHDEPKYEFCFGRFHVKEGTIFVCGFTLFCWIIGFIVGFFVEPIEIFWKLCIALVVIVCISIAPIVGIHKNQAWLLLPFLWYMGAWMFSSVYEFLMIISYAFIRDHSNFSNGVALERKFESLHYKVPLNILLVTFSSWFFSITHSCYVLMCELKHAQTNPNSNIELAALQEY